MSVAEKLRDALSMFWQSLDEEERRIVAYLAVYFASTVVLGIAKQRRARLVAELREEMARGERS